MSAVKNGFCCTCEYDVKLFRVVDSYISLTIVGYAALIFLVITNSWLALSLSGSTESFCYLDVLLL